MNSEKNSSSTKLCPVCGTRLTATASRCLVCGTELDQKTDATKSANIRAKRLPEVTLSLPAILGLLVLFLALIALVLFLVINGKANVPVETAEVAVIEGTATPSPTITETPTNTLTPTEVHQPGHRCHLFPWYCQARWSLCRHRRCFRRFRSKYHPGKQPASKLWFVRRTGATDSSTNSYSLTATYSYTEWCWKDRSSLRDDFLRRSGEWHAQLNCQHLQRCHGNDCEYNGLLSDTVFEGRTLYIPLCQRRPTAGPTPTPTQLPPYPAPVLLLPADGASFISVSDTITLQWAAVGALETNEAYAVTITTSDKRKHLDHHWICQRHILYYSCFCSSRKQTTCFSMVGLYCPANW